jgi:hypothetical protein
LEAGFVDFGTVVSEGGDKGHHDAAEGCHFGGYVEGLLRDGGGCLSGGWRGVLIEGFR